MNKFIKKLTNLFFAEKKIISTNNFEIIAENLVNNATVFWYKKDIDLVFKNILNYVNNLKISNEPFLFKYSESTSSANIYSSAYALMIFNLIGELKNFTEEEKIKCINYFNSFQDEQTGLFYDVNIENEYFNDSDWWGARHLAVHLINVYTALNARPKYPFHFLKEYYDINFLKNWLSSINWNQSISHENDFDNKLMNIGALLQYQRDYWNDYEAGVAIKYIQNFLLEKINPDIGMWGTSNIENKDQLSRMVQFAYHIITLFTYDNIKLPYLEVIVRNVLKTQNKFGGFGVALNSSACEDIDSIYILIYCKYKTENIKKNIDLSLAKAISWILVNQNNDGGFVFRRNESFLYGHKEMYSGINESNLFATWFRTLTLLYALDYFKIHKTEFLKCPGY